MNIKKQHIKLLTNFIILFLLVVTMLSPTEKVMASIEKETIITNLKNPSNGKLSFTLTIPAHTTITYSVKLIPNNKNAAIDSYTNTFSNHSSKEIKKNITLLINYYSTKYKYNVSARYNYRRCSYIDTDYIESKIPANTFVTKKFTWTKKEIKRYKRNKRSEIVLLYSGSVVLDIFVSKGYCTAALSSGYGIGVLVSDLVKTKASEDIRTTAIEGWGYKIKAVPNEERTAYKTYLITYNSKNKKVDEKYCGKVYAASIFRVIR
ncbi:MAG: hypothetical protein HFG29_03110 [Eubacterium sp.]|nr:hypothetical protein [Eubacterium sp.]